MITIGEYGNNRMHAQYYVVDRNERNIRIISICHKKTNVIDVIRYVYGRRDPTTPDQSLRSTSAEDPTDGFFQRPIQTVFSISKCIRTWNNSKSDFIVYCLKITCVQQCKSIFIFVFIEQNYVEYVFNDLPPFVE